MTANMKVLGSHTYFPYRKFVDGVLQGWGRSVGRIPHRKGTNRVKLLAFDDRSDTYFHLYEERVLCIIIDINIGQLSTLHCGLKQKPPTDFVTASPFSA